MSHVGTKIGHIRIVETLGKGGMGEVYVGFDETLERKVAVKAIRSESRLSSEARARFLREARILSQLRHPNICQIHDYVEGKESDFLVLELIEGRNLDAALAEGLDKPRKLRIAEQLAPGERETTGSSLCFRPGTRLSEPPAPRSTETPAPPAEVRRALRAYP